MYALSVSTPSKGALVALPRRTLATVLAGLLTFTHGSHATDDDRFAEKVLRSMHEATRQLNYDGVFVYQRGAQLDSMRLVHAWDGSREQERLISLTGPAREVVRDGSVVTCLFTDDQAAMVDKNPSRDLIGLGFSAPVESLLENYRFMVDGEERVAGRTAHVVAVVPRESDRYAYRLWVDKDSSLLLKSMIIDRGGDVLEQVQFAQLELLDQVPVTRLKPEITGSGFTWRTDEGSPEATGATATAPQDSTWQVGWLPGGFAMRDQAVDKLSTSEMPVAHLVYSDGLAMVSVFIEQLMPDDAPIEGHSSRGAVNAFSQMTDEHQVTVVGELPLDTVRRIAASVTRTGK